MKRFEPQLPGRPVDGLLAGATLSALHVYAVPDLALDTDLGTLVEACRRVMEPFPILSLHDGLLHITLEVVADVPSEAVSAAERADLIAALETSLADTPPFTVLAGSPVASKAGAFLDCWPDDGLTSLHQKVRSAVQAVRGPGAVVYSGGRPHCGLGYSYAAADSDPLQSALRAISPSHAEFTVNQVVLVDVTFTLTETASPAEGTQPAWDFDFTPLHTIALSEPGTPVPHF
ncbi:2'-5' RNA ligase family protein [Streptomyces sp. NPDC056682]|uniref:2'-5' RNA ligase family protein n=1 Tax=Streptomyces sp. NPDC056682 TaxID=3345909 RepID=UPI0036742307